MQADVVGLGEKIVETHQFGSGERCCLGARIGVGNKQPCAEPLQALGNHPADGAKSDQADSLVPQFAALQSAVGLGQHRGISGAGRFILEELGGGNELAGHGQHEAECQISNCHRIAPRREQHRNAEGGAGLNIDVHGIAPTGDHDPQVGKLAEYFGIDNIGFCDEYLPALQCGNKVCPAQYLPGLADAGIFDFKDGSHPGKRLGIEGGCDQRME